MAFDGIESTSVFRLIGERYLDTRHRPEHIADIDAELARRGVKGFRRLACEYLAAAGLWWNVFWWAGDALDEKDVRRGWLQNFVLFAALGAVISFLFGVGAAAAFVIALHLLTLWVGLDLRRGSGEVLT